MFAWIKCEQMKSSCKLCLYALKKKANCKDNNGKMSCKNANRILNSRQIIQKLDLT